MTEEKLVHEQKFPEPAVGALVYNDAGDILLVRGSKFGDYWCFAGGKVEVGETSEETVKREVREELGIEVGTINFLTWFNAVNPEFFYKKAHFIFLDFSARYVAGEVKTNDEISEFQWIKPEEALKKLKIDSYSRQAIEIFIERGGQKDLSSQCEEYKQGWQRALADYKNLQKEVADRRSQMAAISERQILEEFIPVYDNFKKAYANEQLTTNKEQANWVMGIKYIMKQFGDVLKAHSVEEIKTVGEMFDPKFHETTGEEESDQEHGTILKETSGGYTMGGRVIQVARVIIAK